MTKHLTKPIRAIHFMVLAFLMTIGTQVSADILQLLCTEDQKGAIGEPDSHHLWFKTNGMALSLGYADYEEREFLIKYGWKSEETNGSMRSSSVKFWRDSIQIFYSISHLDNLSGSEIEIEIDRTTGNFAMVKTIVNVNMFKEIDMSVVEPVLFERTKVSGSCVSLLDGYKF